MPVTNNASLMFAACGAAVLAALSTANPAPPVPAHAAETVHELMQNDLTGVPGKELQMLTVEYPPGGASPPHRHNAQVFVYVLAGSMKMQVQGSPVVTLGPGQTFYEGRDDIHSVSANASRTESAKILVFMVKDKTSPPSGERPSQQGK